MTDEEQQAYQQQQAELQEQKELAMREMVAKVAKLEGEVEKVRAAANKDTADADSKRYSNAKMQAETGKILKEMERLSQEIRQARAGYEALLSQQIESLTL